MKKTEIIKTLKETYNRDLRKQLVKRILENEKGSENPDYKIINQIFSYVLKELHWNIAGSTREWDSTPLEIMKAVFPKIESSKWFEDQILTSKKRIEVEVKA